MNKTYTKELLEPLVKESQSVFDVVRKLGKKTTSSSVVTFVSKKIKEFGIDSSHFTSHAWSRGKNVHTDPRVSRTSIEEIFCKDSTVSTSVVRRYLETDPNFIHKCSNCGNTEWCEKPIPLELDHIDGNNRNNTRENLRFICLNCHAQTHTFRGKNISKRNRIISDEKFIDAIITTHTPRQALLKLGLTPKGGNYERVYKLIAEHDLKQLD